MNNSLTETDKKGTGINAARTISSLTRSGIVQEYQIEILPVTHFDTTHLAVGNHNKSWGLSGQSAA